jgi:hypothetical protein
MDVAALDVGPADAGLADAAASLGQDLQLRGTIMSLGPMPKEVTQRIIRHNFGRLQLCAERAQLPPDIQETYLLKFTMTPSGEAAEGSTEGPRAELAECLDKAIFGLRFPTAELPTKVAYSIKITTVSCQPGEIVTTVHGRLHVAQTLASLRGATGRFCMASDREVSPNTPDSSSRTCAPYTIVGTQQYIEFPWGKASLRVVPDDKGSILHVAVPLSELRESRSRALSLEVVLPIDCRL